MESIKQEGQRDIPLSELQPVTCLFSEYDNSPVFLSKLLTVSEKYGFIRRVRRDGSCFYRGYIYRILEYIQSVDSDNDQQSAWIKGLQAKIRHSKKDMLSIGIDSVIIEEFIDAIEEGIISKTPALQQVNTASTADYLIMGMRMLTSTSLRKHPEDYSPFLMDQSVDSFCQQEVDPIDREADQL